jgi:DNA uptake protein ComE-like DNA-binding protein
MRPIAVLILAFAIPLSVFTGALPCMAAARPAKTTSSRARPRGLVDINHATLEQLKSLPGVQDALAAKIVKNRPYANKTQLSSRGVVPAALYRRLRQLIIARQ